MLHFGAMFTPPPFLRLFFVALAVRVSVVVLGVALGATQPDPYAHEATPTDTRDLCVASSARLIEPWYRFDAPWLATVAREGYANAADSGGRLGVAFFPAMPASMAAADALGLNPFWTGVLVANLVGAAGAAVFGRVAARQLNDRAAGWRALALLLAFPSAFFYSAPYNESFGLLFTALSLDAWQRNRPAGAGLAALGGSLARMTGGALAVAAVAHGFAARDRRELTRVAWVTAGSLGGVALFWGFLWWVAGDPFAGLKAQAKWGRPELSWRNPLRTVESIYDPELPHWGEAAVVLGVAVLGVRAWRRRGAFWGVVTLVPVAQLFASGSLLSGHRIALASLPAFVEFADIVRGRLPLFATLLGCGYVQFLLLNRYVHWQFAG